MSPRVEVLREVRLHGPLRAQFGRSHWLAVESPAEAVRALCALFRGFREAVAGGRGPGYRVRTGEGRLADWRDERSLTVSAGSATRIDIVPVLHGRKRNGIGQIIIGAILIIAGIYFESPDLIKAGVLMILGGAVALLTPMPRGSDSKSKQEVSQAIAGPPNIVSPGGPVPLIIGRMLVGSVTISAGLSTDEYQWPTTANPNNPNLPGEEPGDWFAQPDLP